MTITGAATEVEVVVHVPCVREPCGGQAPPEGPVREVGRPPPVMLALGRSHSCALTDDGGVYCWGSNSRGQLGDLGREDQVAPSRVPGLPVMSAVWAGADMTCARERDGGTLHCWGETGLGPNREPGFATPLPFDDVRSAALGDRIGCFVDGSAHVYCWGDYGIPHGPRWAAPHRVPLSGVSGISAGASRHCGLDARGRLVCWGRHFNYWGVDRLENDVWRLSGLDGASLLALPFTPASQFFLVDRSGRVLEATVGPQGRREAHPSVAQREVPGISSPVELVGGSGHGCGRLGDGTAACWGSNAFGQLGDGTEADRREARFLPLTSVAEIAAGEHHTCARTDAALYCWGRNDDSQAGGEEHEVHQPTVVPW